MGYDWREISDQRAREKELFEELGLVPDMEQQLAMAGDDTGAPSGGDRNDGGSEERNQ